MPFQFSGLKTQVTISGAVSTNYAVPDGTNVQVKYIGTTSNGSVQSAYTVPASTKYLVYGFGIGQSASGYEVDLYQADGSTKVADLQSGANGSTGMYLMSAIPIQQYNAGEQVYIKGTNGLRNYIYGLLVAV